MRCDSGSRPAGKAVTNSAESRVRPSFRTCPSLPVRCLPAIQLYRSFRIAAAAGSCAGNNSTALAYSARADTVSPMRSRIMPIR
jgi:hypothetical protein